MSYDSDRLGDYNDVASRITEFREKYPTGCLRPADPARPYAIEQVGEQYFVVVVSAAFRTPDDPAPGIGMAWEPIPGRTPYTRLSELQNCETSSWGRALIAVGAADARKGIASAEEVANRRPPRRGRSGTNDALDEPMSDVARKAMHAAFNDAGIRDRQGKLDFAAEVLGLPALESSTLLTERQAREVVRSLREGVAEPKQVDPA